MDGISHHMVVGKEVIMHACTHMKRTHTPLRSSTLARIPRRTGTFASVVDKIKIKIFLIGGSIIPSVPFDLLTHR